MDIDFVVLWVDPTDPVWQAEKKKYSPENDYGDKEERFRDWGLFKYWFRGVEKNAPWVRKIFFVTYGHVPTWLNTKNEKIQIVKHEDYLPKESLPTFNSSLIERYIHRIPGLSEHFVFFNDDMMLINKVSKDYFFYKGLPRDILAFQPVVSNPKNPGMTHLYTNNMLMLSKYFNKIQNVKQHPGNYFHIGYPLLYFFYNILELGFPLYSGLFEAHTASAFLKSSFEELWEKEKDALDSMKNNRFRADNEVNQYVFKEWQKLNGKFKPTNIIRHFKYIEMSDDNRKALKIISKSGKHCGLIGRNIKIICINDAAKISDPETVKKQYIEAFEKCLGEKSSFEI